MRQDRQTFHLIYLLNFLLALAYVLPLYVYSSYLQLYVPLERVGLVVTAATLVTLLAILAYPRLIQRYSNYRVMAVVLVGTALAMFGLGLLFSRLAVITLFTAATAGAMLLGINVDVFLEDISDDTRTGKLRTTLMTCANTALLIAPLAMGWLAAGERYRLVFLAAGAALVAATFTLVVSSYRMRDHYRYRSRPIKELLTSVSTNPKLRKVFAVAWALQTFYCFMVLYLPPFLHQTLGFSWTTLGLMFTVMLLPFVVLELPAGKVADRFLGEKEILIAGLTIMAVFTGLIFFLRSDSPLVWTAVLFMSRVGAALTEAMVEVYFFKQINRTDVDLINLFRDLKPAAWLTASLGSAMLLAFWPVPALFLVLAALLIFALRPALTLEDTPAAEPLRAPRWWPGGQGKAPRQQAANPSRRGRG